MRVTFFRVAERKSPKKGRPYCLRPLRCATGQPGVLGHGVHRRTRCAPAALRSNNCGESVHEACALRRACHPAPCAPQAHPEGNPRIGHPHGPLLRCAALGPVSRAQAPRAAQAGPSAAKARMAVLPPPCPSGCAEERRVWRIRARDCLSEVKRSEFERDPAKPEHRRLPRS